MSEPFGNRLDLEAAIEQRAEAPEPASPKEEPMLFVILDCIYYVAGERVTGELLINMPYSYPAATLRLKSGGTEEVHLYEGLNHSTRESQTADVYSLESEVHEFPEGVPAGQYVHPFTFKLPHYSPATFRFAGDVHGCFVKASIDYFCMAELEVHSESALNLRHSRPILVCNRKAKSKVNESVETVHVVPSCCCATKGRTRLKLTIKNQDHSQSGGFVKYKLDPDNSQCSAAINHVVGITSVSLGFILPSRALRIHKELNATSRATWLSASTSMIYEKDFEYSVELKHPQEDWNLSSNDGALISCEYTIEILVHFDVAFRQVPATVRLPFQVNPKNIYPKEAPNVPVAWTPLEVPIKNLIVKPKRTVSEESPGKMSKNLLPV